MQSIVGDPYYNAVGIGLAYNAGCQWGNIWVLDTANFNRRTVRDADPHTIRDAIA